MEDPKNSGNKYFQDALSDFVYDASSGRAIRHLVNAGYTAAQIMNELHYPTPYKKIQHTVTRYLKESGILLEELPLQSSALHTFRLGKMPQDALFSLLARHVADNGEENSYISCPFGTCATPAGYKPPQAFSMLTAREREYLDGIEWGEAPMYHRLNRRMLEIGVQLAGNMEEIHFYFLKGGEEMIYGI